MRATTILERQDGDPLLVADVQTRLLTGGPAELETDELWSGWIYA